MPKRREPRGEDIWAQSRDDRAGRVNGDSEGRHSRHPWGFRAGNEGNPPFPFAGGHLFSVPVEEKRDEHPIPQQEAAA